MICYVLEHISCKQIFKYAGKNPTKFTLPKAIFISWINENKYSGKMKGG